MDAVQVPVSVKPGAVKWNDIELFRRRFGALWANFKDLKVGTLSGWFSKQPDGRYVGGFDLPSEHRLKGLYVDFRHFYLNDEPTNAKRFANYLATLTTSQPFRRFIKEEKQRMRSRFLEDGWFEHKGKRLSTKQFLDVWFNAEIFHNNSRETKTLLEWMDVFTSQTAKSMLFMAVYDSILVIRNINWAAIQFSAANMNLRMPNAAMQPVVASRSVDSDVSRLWRP